MNNATNSQLAWFYLRTLSRIRQKNQIRLLVDAVLIEMLCKFVLYCLNLDTLLLLSYYYSLTVSCFAHC